IAAHAFGTTPFDDQLRSLERLIRQTDRDFLCHTTVYTPTSHDVLTAWPNGSRSLGQRLRSKKRERARRGGTSSPPLIPQLGVETPVCNSGNRFPERRGVDCKATKSTLKPSIYRSHALQTPFRRRGPTYMPGASGCRAWKTRFVCMQPGPGS